MLPPTTILALTSLLREDAFGRSAAAPRLPPFFAFQVAKVCWHATLTASLVLRMILTDLKWFIAMTFFFSMEFVLVPSICSHGGFFNNHLMDIENKSMLDIAMNEPQRYDRVSNIPQMPTTQFNFSLFVTIQKRISNYMIYLWQLILSNSCLAKMMHQCHVIVRT
jgi:hypothetical protein